MALFLDDAVPAVLGMNLLRFAPQYTAMRAFQPRVVHDFAAIRTKKVQLDRFKTWGERGLTKSARRRDKGSIIGTNNAESLTKTTTEVTISEYTGPSDPAGNASTLHLTKEDMLFARQQLWQYGLREFHEAIGSAQLADDYQRWMDRVIMEEAASGADTFNPGGIATGSVSGSEKIASNDLALIEYKLAKKNSPRYKDGLYHMLASLEFLTHLFQDTDFKQTARAVLQGGQVPIEQSPLYIGMNSQPAAVGGMPMQAAMLAPLVYGSFMIFPTNNLPSVTRNSQTGFRSLAFGPDTVGIGSGGRGPVVEVDSATDFNRHFHFIWSWWGDVVNLSDQDENSGTVIEACTFSASTFA